MTNFIRIICDLFVIIGWILIIISGAVTFLFWIEFLFTWLGLWAIAIVIVIPPSFMIFPFVYWIVEGIFPGMYFLFWALGLLGLAMIQIANHLPKLFCRYGSKHMKRVKVRKTIRLYRDLKKENPDLLEREIFEKILLSCQKYMMCNDSEIKILLKKMESVKNLKDLITLIEHTMTGKYNFPYIGDSQRHMDEWDEVIDKMIKE